MTGRDPYEAWMLERADREAWAREPCGCERTCGDDGDTEGPGTCKGLPRPKSEPLVEIVLVDRRDL